MNQTRVSLNNRKQVIIFHPSSAARHHQLVEVLRISGGYLESIEGGTSLYSRPIKAFLLLKVGLDEIEEVATDGAEAEDVDGVEMRKDVGN